MPRHGHPPPFTRSPQRSAFTRAIIKVLCLSPPVSTDGQTSRSRRLEVSYRQLDDGQRGFCGLSSQNYCDVLTYIIRVDSDFIPYLSVNTNSILQPVLHMYNGKSATHIIPNIKCTRCTLYARLNRLIKLILFLLHSE